MSKNIYQKLQEARKLVRETKHKKAGTNTYSNYDYFTPEQVELIVAEVTEETGTVCLCSLKADENGLYQELTLLDIESPDNRVTFQLRTKHGQMKATNEAQQMGGTDTYSERYIKMKVFQIKDNNLDPDSQDNKATGSPKVAGKDIDDFDLD
jgi:hypothetical protein